MRRALAWLQGFTRAYKGQLLSIRSMSTRAQSLPKAVNASDIHAFREHAFGPERPFHFASKAGSPTAGILAAQRWFLRDGEREGRDPLSHYLKSFSDSPFLYELVILPNQTEAGWGTPTVLRFRDWLMNSGQIEDQVLAGILHPVTEELGSQSFFQLYAPLQLLAKAIEFNYMRKVDEVSAVQLYIAQSSLMDLPAALRDDLTTPDLVLSAGKGDVYNSSIWLGTEPTYTPLHRDPNPNLFCQLYGGKTARLLPPKIGDQVFFEVQARIQQSASSRIRTTSMMEGKEREELHETIWGTESVVDGVYEVDIAEGDALFIPTGWWHSLRSKNSNGRLNASVNWWFR